MTPKTGYRLSHASKGYGSRYDANYEEGYYAALYREFEVPTLQSLFAEFSSGENTHAYLDFACGTGRITKVAIPYFRRIVGVDVSSDMLANAREAVNAEFIELDLTRQSLPETFNVVTAFRFFLNAEDELRRQALIAIKGHLAEDGYLVCNIHMNSRSVMGCIYALTRLAPGLTSHQTLSYESFARILEDAGFSVERVIWYGVTPRPGRFFGRFLDRNLGALERFFDKIGLRDKVGHSFIVVARHAKIGEQSKRPGR